MPAPLLEFMFETTRAVTDLVPSGVLRRHPDLRIIVPHAGAVLPVLASRIDMFAAALAYGADVPSLRAALKTLHFDLAGMSVEEQLAALLAVADPSRLHYGSDFPFTPWQGCRYLAQQLQHSQHLDARALATIFEHNTAQPLRGRHLPA